MFILDTSAVIEILKGTKKGSQIINLVGTDPIAITVFSVYELFIGARDNEFGKIDKLFSETIILDFGKEAALESVKLGKELLKSGKPIEEIDIFIASICTSQNSVLVTLDKDFENIKTLGIKLI